MYYNTSSADPANTRKLLITSVNIIIQSGAASGKCRRSRRRGLKKVSSHVLALRTENASSTDIRVIHRPLYQKPLPIHFINIRFFTSVATVDRWGGGVLENGYRRTISNSSLERRPSHDMLIFQTPYTIFKYFKFTWNDDYFILKFTIRTISIRKS